MTIGSSAPDARSTVNPTVAHGRFGGLMLGALGVVYGDYLKVRPDRIAALGLIDARYN
jgi:hypothetical protein